MSVCGSMWFIKKQPQTDVDSSPSPQDVPVLPNSSADVSVFLSA